MDQRFCPIYCVLNFFRIKDSPPVFFGDLQIIQPDLKIETKDDQTILLEVKSVEASNVGALRRPGDQLKKLGGYRVIVVGSLIEDRPMVIVMATDDAVKAGIHAGNIAKGLADKMGGGGGGSASVAQAGGKTPDQLAPALDATEQVIRATLENGSNG